MKSLAYRRSAINTHSHRRAALALLAILAATPIALLSSIPVSATPIPGNGSHGGDASPTLMAAPDTHATLMPVPGGAPASDGHADDNMDNMDNMDGTDGMAGMDSHSDASMPSVSTPDAPQRHLVLGGFAVANTFVLGAAAMMRRKGGAGRHGKAKPAAPARTTRKSTITDGGAA